LSIDKEQAKIENIRKYILKSGFPSEIEVGNILRKANWIVINQAPYIDKITKKIRTIDVSAFKPVPIPKLKGFQVIVECKKSEQHEWVFHTQHKTNEYQTAMWTLAELFKTMGNPAIMEKFNELSKACKATNLFGYPLEQHNKQILSSKMSSLTKLHYFDETIRMGIMHLMPNKNDDFFEATQQIGAIVRSMNEPEKNFVQFPVIVFDGEMFEFYQENAEMKVNPINHLQYTLIDGEMPLRTIDIVRKSYFSEFIAMIENDISIYTAFCLDSH